MMVSGGDQMSSSLFHGDLVTSQRILYTPTQFARTALLSLQEIGELQAQKPHTSSRNHLPSFLFCMVVSGRGKLMYQNNEFELRANDCFFVDCQQPYSHTTDFDLWCLRWIHFTGPTMRSIYNKYVERGGRPVITPDNMEEFFDIWQKTYSFASSDDYIRDMRINEQLTMLLTHIMEYSYHTDTAAHISYKRDKAGLIRDYLSQNFSKALTLDHIAETFSINKYYLTRIFKSHYGISMNVYLTQLRITHAKHLLRFTNSSIESIGISCGIPDPNYFSRLFRKIEGISPSEYRQIW